MFALAVAWVLIVGMNFTNDYSDGIHGTDDDRSGPLRLTGSGLVESKVVKYAALGAFGVAGLAGTALSMMSVWWLTPVGALCIAAAWFYTGDKNPYGYRGLGEVSVFVFFGLAAMPGAEFTQIGSLSWVDLACVIGISSALSAANPANNLCDIPTDTVTGKVTLAVRLGDLHTRIVWQILSIMPALAGTFIVLWRPWALVGLPIALPWAKASEPIRMHKKGKEFIPVLGPTDKMMLAWSVTTALVLTFS